MCVVSMVTDSFMKRWPEPAHLPRYDYTILKDLIRKAEEYDRLTKQPECPEPVKADWLTRVQELERKREEEGLKWVPTNQFSLADQYKVTLGPVNLNTMPPASYTLNYPAQNSY